MPAARAPDVLVIGGGIVGAAIAERCARDGLAVTLVERGRIGAEASWAAAGLLTPVHPWNYPEPLLRLDAEGLALWGPLAARLREETGTDVELRRTGLLSLIETDDDAAEAERRVAWKRAHGERAERLSAEDARRLEPSLAPSIRGALLMPDLAQVRNHRAAPALAAAAARRGARIVEGVTVRGLLVEGADTARSSGFVVPASAGARLRRTRGTHRLKAGLRTNAPPEAGETNAPPEGGTTNEQQTTARRAPRSLVVPASAGAVVGVDTDAGPMHAGMVVLAAGAWSGALLGDACPPAMRTVPCRGQMLLLRAAPDTLRHMVLASGDYLVPRADGHVLAGSTLERVGFDRSTTDAARASISAAVARMTPPLAAAPVERHWAGLRPDTPDHLPAIGVVRPGLVAATGHYRSGIMLAPVTAEIVLDLVRGRARTDLAAFDPLR